MKYLLPVFLMTILLSCSNDKQQAKIDELETQIKELQKDRQTSQRPNENRKASKGIKETLSQVEEITGDSALGETPEQIQFQKEIKGLKVSIESYKSDGVGYLGHIRVKVENLTKYHFKYLAADVNYIRANGDLYKKERVYFYEVEPYTIEITRAPESNRGINLTAELVDGKSKALERDRKRIYGN